MKRSKLLNKNKTTYNSAVERYRKKRKKEKIVILLLIIVISSIFLFVNSSFVKIKNINITGIEQLNKEDIIQKSGVTENTKIWKVNSEEIKNILLENFNIIGEIQVETKLLDTINISIKEKKLVAKELNDNNTFDVVLETGESYNGIINNDFSLPILDKFNDDKEKKNNVVRNLLELKPEVLSSISEIVNDKENNELLMIYMKDGQKVKVHSGNFSQKLNYYLEISKYIEDKRNTVLNLVNGSYLETKKSLIDKDNNIKKILERSNGAKSSKDADNKAKKEKSENYEHEDLNEKESKEKNKKN